MFDFKYCPQNLLGNLISGVVAKKIRPHKAFDSLKCVSFFTFHTPSLSASCLHSDGDRERAYEDQIILCPADFSRKNSEAAGGQRVRLAECKYIRSSGILQHVVVATKRLVVCVDTPQQAERLLHSSLCSPAQVFATNISVKLCRKSHAYCQSLAAGCN